MSAQTKLQEWATKSGRPLVELENLYKDKYATLPSSTPQAQKEKRALQLVKAEIETSMKSPAIMFQGVIIGISDTMDLMKKQRDAAMTQYNANPAAALSGGLAKMDGARIVLMDNRPTLNNQPNKNFGKPLAEHFYVRRLIMAVKKPEDLTYKQGIFMMRGDAALVVPPMGQSLEFRALGQETNGIYDLRSSQTTKFKTTKPLTSEELYGIISSVFADKTKPLGECMNFHATIKEGDYNAFVVTEGTVSFMKRIEKETARSDMMVVSDETLPMGQDGVQCWVPKDLRPYINFGTGSIVSIIAKTGIGKGYNRETKQQTDEDRLMLNVMGVIPLPGFATTAEDSNDPLS